MAAEAFLPLAAEDELLPLTRREIDPVFIDLG